MDPVVQPAAPAPAQPAAVTPEPAARPDFAAFEQQETARDLARVAGKPEPKPAAAPVGDDAPAVDAKGQPVTGTDGKPVSRRQQEANRRIQDAIERGTAEARQRAEAAERRAAELEAKYKPAEQPQAAAEDREPVLDDFLDQPDPYLALTKALVKYERAQERKAEAAERETTTRARTAEEHAQKTFTTYQERETAFKATAPDFDAKTEQVRHALNLQSPLTMALIDSPVAPQLILHLAEHKDDFDRIGALGATNLPAALRELGKLEAKYDTPAAPPAPAAPAAKHVTSAPAPGTFLGSQSAPAADAKQAAIARKDFSAYDAEATQRDLARAGRR